MHLQAFALPNVVHISPVGFGRSEASLAVLLTDDERTPLPGMDIVVTTDRGAVRSGTGRYGLATATKTDDSGVARAEFSANWESAPGVTPGVASVSFSVSDSSSARTYNEVVFVTVVGPPAAATVTVSPASLLKGEAATIAVRVLDAIGQNVGDGHVVRLATNHGGVVFPDSPQTWGGAAFAFLLTDRAHEGVHQVAVMAQDPAGLWPPVPALASIKTSSVTSSAAETEGTPAPSQAPSPVVLPHGLKAILVMDISGSTTMNSKFGDERWFKMRQWHLLQMQAAIAIHKGYVFKDTGDGLMVGFGSAKEAVMCALEMQRLSLESVPDADIVIPIHVGIEIGEPIESAGDLFGSSVNMATRIAGEARAGQTLVSSSVRDIIEATSELRAGEGISVQLKGFAEQHLVYPLVQTSSRLPPE
jgi:class 3 adenylate cyclase